MNGQNILPSQKPFPQKLEKLFTNQTKEGRYFRKNIRAFNSAFAMTSLGINKEILPPGIPTFKIYGQIHHLIGHLGHSSAEPPKFAQIYLYEMDKQQKYRSLLNGLDTPIGIFMNHCFKNVNKSNICNFNRELFFQIDAVFLA